MIAASFSVSLTFPPRWSSSSFWLERVGPDRERRVLALLVLAQLRPDPCEKNGEAERLRHIVVGARLEAENGVGIGVLARQHDDRRLVAALAQKLDGFTAIHVRQPDIHDQEIDHSGTRGVDALRGGALLQHVELLIERQLLDQRRAKVFVVVDDENCP